MDFLLPPDYRELFIELKLSSDKKDTHVQGSKAQERLRLFQSISEDHRNIILNIASTTSEIESTKDSTRLDKDKQMSPLPVNAKAIQTMRESFCKRIRSSDIEFSRSKLPVSPFKSQIIDKIANNQVLLVTGSTGSGKSTQIPQFVLESWLASQSLDTECNVVCTQPRRISATSLAARVSQEMGDGVNAVGKNGSLVGYEIRLERKVSATTRLTFCTTGIFLKHLESGNRLQHISHVIIDEVLVSCLTLGLKLECANHSIR